MFKLCKAIISEYKVSLYSLQTKCHQYWPHLPDVKHYEDLQVCCHSEECNLAYVNRELTLTHTQVTRLES